MDDEGALAEFKPARFWVVMQHVFMAALTLATDVSFNPGFPEAEARKAKVMAAYQTLDRSRQESSTLMEGVQKNMQTLVATLPKQRTKTSRSQLENFPGISTGESVIPEDIVWSHQVSRDLGEPHIVEEDAIGLLHPSSNGPGDESDLDQLWSNFVNAAPNLDPLQWTCLLDDVDLSFEPDIY